MLFALITFLAAFSIEGLGTYVSVIGLSTLFGANPIIIALAISLDVGKLVVVSLLYKHWKALGVVMRSYALVAAVITMVITSAGAAGYLSGEFQKAILGTQEVGLKVDVLKQQIAKYEERKKQIDNQIAAIPEKYSPAQRIRLMNQFKAEQQDLQTKIAAIDKELPALQIQQIGVEAKAGPILYISKAFNVPVEVAVKWVILMIIFVFDPLAVFLIIAGNFLWDQRKRSAAIEIVREQIRQVPTPALTDQEFEQRTEKVREAVETYDDFTLAEPPTITGLAPPIEPAITKADVERIAVENYPDTTLTKTYTRDDLIAAGVSDEQLVDAGYEPREAAIEAAIEAAPAEPEVAPAIAPDTPENAAIEAAPVAPHPVEELQVNANGVRVPIRFREPSAPEAILPLETQNRREQITLSSLGLVKPDPSTVVDANDTTGLGALDPRSRPDIYNPGR